MSVAEAPSVKENLYEGLFLVDSNGYANDADGTTATIMSILERAGATVVAHRPWQDGKLAYEIRSRRKGLHYIVCFRMPPSGMNVLTRQCQLSETVLRQLVICHRPDLFNAMVDAISGNIAESEQTKEATAKS